MQRINTLTKATDLFGSGKHGFKAGTPPSGASTRYSPEWSNDLQENLIRAAEVFETSPKASAYEQLASIFRRLAYGNHEKHVNPSGSPWASDHLYAAAYKIGAGSEVPTIIFAGVDRLLLRTQDGRTFTDITDGVNTDDLFGIAVQTTGTPRKWCAVGEGGLTRFSTNDGTSWANPSGSHGVTENLRSVVNLPGTDTWIIVGLNGTILRTTDGGANWTTPTDPNSGEDYYGVAYGNGRLVAVGDNKHAIYSTDNGVNWSASDLGGTSTLFRSVAYGKNALGADLWVAVGDIASSASQGRTITEALFATDPDGWTTMAPQSSSSANETGEFLINYFNVAYHAMGGWHLCGSTAALGSSGLGVIGLSNDPETGAGGSWWQYTPPAQSDGVTIPVTCAAFGFRGWHIGGQVGVLFRSRAL